MPDADVAFPVRVKDWEKKFSEKPEEWFFGREPSEMARLTLNYWRLQNGDSKGRVLDHGCGEGRDSVFFAERGFDVTSVDGAASALEKLERLSAEKGVTIADVRHTDVRKFEPEAPFDIVLSHNSLQFLGPDCLSELRRLQDMTAPGGLTSISAFTKEAEALANQHDLYRFDHNELKFRFESWRLFYYGEFLLWRDPAQQYLTFAHILAQKPA